MGEIADQMIEDMIDGHDRFFDRIGDYFRPPHFKRKQKDRGDIKASWKGNQCPVCGKVLKTPEGVLQHMAATECGDAVIMAEHLSPGIYDAAIQNAQIGEDGRLRVTLGNVQPHTHVDCNYCGNPAELVGGEHVYPHRPDLYDKKFWVCDPCGARVGTHEGDPLYRPYGTLATHELRRLRRRVHELFDPLWQGLAKSQSLTRSKARALAYDWLADHLEISRDDCHMGKFDEQLCTHAIELYLSVTEDSIIMEHHGLKAKSKQYYDWEESYLKALKGVSDGTN